MLSGPWDSVVLHLNEYHTPRCSVLVITEYHLCRYLHIITTSTASFQGSVVVEEFRILNILVALRRISHDTPGFEFQGIVAQVRTLTRLLKDPGLCFQTII